MSSSYRRGVMNYDNTRICVGNNLSKVPAVASTLILSTPPKRTDKTYESSTCNKIDHVFGSQIIWFPKNLGAPSEFSNSKNDPVWDVFSSMVRRTFNLKPSSTSSMASFKGRRRFRRKPGQDFSCDDVCMAVWMLLPQIG